MKNKVNKFKLLACVLFTTLAACSGGNSGDSSDSTSNQAPEGGINTPVTNMKIGVGESINFSASSSDPDGNLPLTYLWNFDAGSGITDANTQAPGQIQFNNEGVFTVSFTVTDALGLADPTPATRIITVGNQAPDGTIDAPSTDLTINVGDSLNFTATGSDPNDDLPLTYQWDFGSSGIANTNTEDPGLKQFKIAGTYTVSLTVTDSQGLSDPTPDVVTITVKTATQNLLPNLGWSLLSVDNEEIVAEDGAATNAFDGDKNTFWHSAYFPQPAAPHPHDIQISLGGTYLLSAFSHLPRQDGSTRGRTEDYQFYTSLDGNKWTLVVSGSLTNSDKEQKLQFTPERASYVRFKSRSEYDGGSLTAVAELSLFGDKATANLAPNGTIDDPSENIIINVSDTLNFNGTASDFEGNVPFSYQWDFGTGSGIPNANIEDPMIVQFNNEGVFDVSFTVSDSRGATDPTPAVRTINVCTPPSVSIIEPENRHIQSSSTLSVQTHACLDSNTHAGWGVRLKLENSTGTTIKTTDDTNANFTGLTKEEHTVLAIVIDQSGSEVGGTEREVTQVGIGDYFIAAGDSITLGLHDDLPNDDTSPDGRNSLGGFTPVLNDRLTTRKGYPHTIVNKGIAGATTVEGVSLMPSTLASNPQAQFVLIQFGTNDAGIPLDKNTFKDNMQQMITLVKNAGKQAYLAKAPYAKGSFSGRNALIREYNQVIDRLITDNSISVAAPDFYSYFESHQDQYADDLHPNGTGYRSMAELWLNVITP